MDFKNAVIAIATDDGTTVSSHFGRARFYEVLNFSDGKVTKRERREKAGHHSFAPAEKEHTHHGDEHHIMMKNMSSDIKRWCRLFWVARQ